MSITANKNLPFTLEELKKLTENIPTPFYLYEEKGIRKAARDLQLAFQENSSIHITPSLKPKNPQQYKNFFAVKALPNPAILRILKQEGMGADCSSLAELLLAAIAGFKGEEIMFTSNNTSAEEFKEAAHLGAIINFDDIAHLDFYKKEVGSLPKLGCARFNPGQLKNGNSIIGEPLEAKFGATREQMIEIYKKMKAEGVERYSIHTMVASNCLDPEYLIDTARILFELMLEIRAETGIAMEFVNLGGGFGIPYRPEQNSLSIAEVAAGIQKLLEEMLVKANYPRPRLCTENGRWVTGPFGYLITKVQHIKRTYKYYIGVDACMANLMRPGMYGAFHFITVLGKENLPSTNIYDITGSLCENNDKFAIDRSLPEIEVDDILVIHDAGAHGHAMGFNYNGKLRSAEYLLKEDRTLQMIRRAETMADHFATLV